MIPGMKFLRTLSSYVPKTLLHKIRDASVELEQAFEDTYQGALLFADISGFTPLTEQFAQAGPAGAEKLASFLNDYFGRLIDLVEGHGGDVVKFAGDALIAIWTDQSTGESLDRLAAAACQCALQGQSAVRGYRAEQVALSMRMSVGAGEIIFVQLGGRHGRWETVVQGDALRQAGAAEAAAQPGQVNVSAPTWRLISDRFEGIEVDDGNVQILQASDPMRIRSAPKVSLPVQMQAQLQGYVPPIILSRLSAGQSDWLAELRHVTILFLHLPHFEHLGSLDSNNRLIQRAQDIVVHYEGSINKLNIDDKGISLLVVFGLPPHAHEDDPLRGILAAQAFENMLAREQVEFGIGITSGLAFCGAVGNSRRREYTIMGDVVNLAARLMLASKNGTLCDEPTYEATESDIKYEILEPIQVKGKQRPIAIFRPQAGKRLPKLLRRSARMVGRKQEMSLIRARLQRFLEAGETGVIIIEGEAGIGKSRLTASLITEAEAAGITVLAGSGDAIEKLSPYHAWRPIFRSIFLPESGSDSTFSETSILRALSDQKFVQFAPLLNDVVPLELSDNPYTAQMVGEVRAENTRSVLIHVLGHASRSARTLIVLEDGHWLDSASWAMLQAVAQRLPSVFLVLVIRPLGESPPAEFRQLMQHPGLVHIPLTTMPAEDILTLISQRLGVRDLPGPVADLILTKAQGNPFFSEELAIAMCETGIIEIQDGRVLAPEPEDLAIMDLPNTVQGAITSRIDRLGTKEQLTLKVASVIGRIFPYITLREVHPIVEDRPHLMIFLEKLAALDITPLETPEPELAYIFKHIITQEVVYNLLLFAQRRQLHRRVAVWMESYFASELPVHYPILAHHWKNAENAVRAIDYLEKAGDQALNRFANEEAIRFFREMAALLDQAGVELPAKTFRMARAYSRMGQAHYGLGQLEDFDRSIRRSLELLGSPMPKGGPAILLGLLGQVGSQIFRRIADRSLDRLSRPERQPVLLETANCFAQMGLVFYYANQTLPAVYTVIRQLNLAEQAGPTDELVRAYVGAAFVAGLIPIHALAEYYVRQALNIVEDLEQISTRVYSSVVIGLYYTGAGYWPGVLDRVYQAQDQADRLGDHRQWGETTVILATAEMLTGNFRKSEALFQALTRRGQQQKNALHTTWGLDGEAMHALHKRQPDQAVALAEQALALLENNPDRITEIELLGILARARLRYGGRAGARAAADRALKNIRKNSPTGPFLFVGYSGVAETYLTVLAEEIRARGGQRSLGMKRSREICRHFRVYSRIFAIGRPYSWYFQGWLEFLSGSAGSSKRAWQRSLQEAERLQMSYEAGLAHYGLGRYFQDRDPRRARTHLEKSSQLFEETGADHDQARAQKAISSGLYEPA